MSIGTILGLVVALVLFLGSIALSTDDFLIFFSGASFLLVIGGTLASAFISFEAYMAGQTQKAINDYRAALKVHPNWLPALQALQDLGVQP